MGYVWADTKAARHLAKHHVPFEYAARVFLDPWRLDAPDQRHDYGETRRSSWATSTGGYWSWCMRCAA